MAKRPAKAWGASARRATRGVKLKAIELGAVKCIEYTRGGKLYRHEFKAGSKLGYLPALRAVVIPARLTAGNYIAD